MASVDYSTPKTAQTAPWFGGSFGERDVVPGGDMLKAADFPLAGSVTVTTSASAAQGATSVSVVALSGEVPSGALLDFGGAKFARLTATAAKGATTIAVAALPTALASGDAATYRTLGGKRFVEGGTLLGRTYTERSNGDGFGPYASGDTDVYLLLYDVPDADRNADCAIVRHGAVVYENKLPESSRTSGALSVIRSNYTTLVLGGN